MYKRLIRQSTALNLVRMRLQALPPGTPVTLYRDIVELPPVDGWLRSGPGPRFALVLPPDESCVLAPA